MASEENIIVAIELGSSKVTGAAGKKMMDGSIQVLALTQEESASFVKRGVVYNIYKTALSISSIVNKLQAQLKKQISGIYVGFGGQGVRSVRNSIVRDLDNDTVVSQNIVDEICKENRETQMNERTIFDVVPQEFIVGSQKTNEPVGILTSRIEGHFLNLVTRSSVLTNMSNCFHNAGINTIDYICTPQVLADSVLTEVDKRSGCALVDLGKDTTTVSVYKGNFLRYLAVIPLGMGNITTDLTGLQIEYDEAEELKLKYGSAYTDISDEDESTMYALRDGRQIEKSAFCDIVEARTEEIIQNVILQIEKSGYGRDTLLAGIVLTGGGSNMKDIEKAFTTITPYEKIRTAKTVTFNVVSARPAALVKDGRMNVVLGLLAKCKKNCCGEKLSTGQKEMFPQTNPVPATEPKPGPTSTNEIDKQAEQKRKEAEEEAARKAAEKARLEAEADERRKREEEKRRKAEAKAARKEEKRRKRTEFFNKIKRTMTNWVTPDEED